MKGKLEGPDVMTIVIKRIYQPREPDDGYRVLVDRLWPRGFSKERADVDEWLRDISPSDALRRWFDHVPERWPEFKTRFAAELDTPECRSLVSQLRKRAAEGPLTLVYASREERYNNAAAIMEVLEAVDRL